MSKLQKNIFATEFAWKMSHFKNGMKFTWQHDSDLNKHSQKRWVIVYTKTIAICLTERFVRFFGQRVKNILNILKIAKKYKKG